MTPTPAKLTSSSRDARHVSWTTHILHAKQCTNNSVHHVQKKKDHTLHEYAVSAVDSQQWQPTLQKKPHATTTIDGPASK